MPDRVEPTEEQIQWFWEQCGFRFIEDKEYDYKLEEWEVHYPNGEWHHDYKKDIGKLIDLNNLFRYAAPKLQDKGYMVELYSYEQKGYKVSIWNIFGEVDIPMVITKDDDPALALFWAIYEALGGK